MKKEDQKTIKQEYVDFFDSKKLHNTLALAALYLATFEILKSTLITNIRSFFFRLEADVMTKEMPAGYQKEMKKYFKVHSGKKDREYLACSDWLKDIEANK